MATPQGEDGAQRPASNDLLNDVDCSEYLAKKQADADAVSNNSADGGTVGTVGTVQVWLGDQPQQQQTTEQRAGDGGGGADEEEEVAGHESNDLMYHLCIDQIGSDQHRTYSCVPDLSDNSDGKVIPYEYNIHILDSYAGTDEDGRSTSIEERTVEVEGVMIRYLAEQLGLDDCPSSGGGRSLEQRKRPERRSLLRQLRRRELGGGDNEEDEDDGQENEEEQPSPLVGISSEPWDMVDRSTECKAHYLGPTIPSKCVHMKGSFAAYFEPSTTDEVKTSEIKKILHLIQQGMATDKFKTAAIPIVVYTAPMPNDYGSDSSGSGNADGSDSSGSSGSGNGGDQGADAIPGSPSIGAPGNPTDPSDYLDPDIVEVNEAQPSSSGEGGGGGGMSPAVFGAIGAIAVVALLIGAVFVRRRRRRRSAAGGGGGRNKYAVEVSSSSRGGGAGHCHMDVHSGHEVTLKDFHYPGEGKPDRAEKAMSHASASDDGHDTLPTNRSGSYDLSDDNDVVNHIGVEIGTASPGAASNLSGSHYAASPGAASNLSGSHYAASPGSGSNCNGSNAGSNYNGSNSGSNNAIDGSRGGGSSHGGGGGGGGGGGWNAKTTNTRRSSFASATRGGGFNDQQDAAGAADDNDFDDASSVASEESGVTIELDMARVNSTVSDVTWIGPDPSIISRFPPYRPPRGSMYSGPNGGGGGSAGGGRDQGIPAIHEVDSTDYDEKDEDPLVLVGRVDRTA